MRTSLVAFTERSHPGFDPPSSVAIKREGLATREGRALEHLGNRQVEGSYFPRSQLGSFPVLGLNANFEARIVHVLQRSAAHGEIIDVV
jgi:hypothetical protein